MATLNTLSPTDPAVSFDSTVAYGDDEGRPLPAEEYQGHPNVLQLDELCMVRVISKDEIEFCSTVHYPGCRFKYQLRGEETAIQMLHRFETQFRARNIPILVIYGTTIVNLENVTMRKQLPNREEHTFFRSERDGEPMSIIWENIPKNFHT